jgi:hypothetical protein
MPKTVGQHLARQLEALLREHLDASWTDETEDLEALGEAVSESGRNLSVRKPAAGGRATVSPSLSQPRGARITR